MENMSSDLVRYCMIISDRNRLQRVKTSARLKHKRIQDVIFRIQTSSKKKKLERIVNYENGRTYKKLAKIDSINESFDNMKARGKTLITAGVNEAIENLKFEADKAEEELLRNDYVYRKFSIVPKKYKKFKISYLKCLEKQANAVFLKASADLSEYTLKTYKEVRLLSKKLGSRQQKDAMNIIQGLRLPDSFLDIKKIEEIVLNYKVESILLEAYNETVN